MQKLFFQRSSKYPTSDRLAVDLNRVALGDVDAFVRVYHATSAKLFGIVVRILGRGDLAEEILQEVYLRVWHRAKEFDATRSSPITWLATVARNRALDEGRRRTMSSIEDLPDVFEIPSGEDIAADHLAQEDLRRLQLGLAQLSSVEREVIELVYFDGLARNEAAVRMGVSASTISTLLRNGLKQLKGAFQL